jgi:hypothetical protein
MAARRALPELGSAHTYLWILESQEISGSSNTESQINCVTYDTYHWQVECPWREGQQRFLVMVILTIFQATDSVWLGGLNLDNVIDIASSWCEASYLESTSVAGRYQGA